MHTLTSLFTEMKKTANAGGADFAAISLPVRSQLCPMPGAETSFAGMDYDAELAIVKQACETDCIPFCDVEKAAEALPVKEREKFYLHSAPDTAGPELHRRCHPAVCAQATDHIRCQI